MSEQITLSNGKKFTIYSNVPLTGTVSTIDRAVIVVHGTDLNAADYYSRMMTAAKKAAVMDRTIVIAPLFDPWASTWRQGGLSNGVSSFAVADQLIALLSRRSWLPRLARIAVAGHSAGAQYVQRYALFGEPQTPALVSYVVANPSTYCFLDWWRPVSTSKCKTYDDYKHGMQKRPSYVSAMSVADVCARYAGRLVTIANGAKDTGLDGDLDVTCPANCQGKNRLERGTAFSTRVKKMYPLTKQQYIVVPNVAHSSSGMFNSSLLRQSLFG